MRTEKRAQPCVPAEAVCRDDNFPTFWMQTRFPCLPGELLLACTKLLQGADALRHRSRLPCMVLR